MWDLWWTKWHLDRFFSSSRTILPVSCQCHSSGIQQSFVILLFMLYNLNNWNQSVSLTDNPRNFSLLVIKAPDASASPRIFH